MGGMVSAADDLPQALARETWEEAGLRLDQLQALTYGAVSYTHLDVYKRQLLLGLSLV